MPDLNGFLIIGFALLGIAAGLSTRGAVASRPMVNIFILYTLGLSFGAGLLQREVWPFSAWPLVAGKVPQIVTQPRILAFDADGKEHEIDYRAWAPLEFDELMGWEEKTFAVLDRESKDRVAAYLLGVVETARQRWAAGDPERHFDKYLGPFSAPFFLGHPDRWAAGVRVPGRPFVGLRIFKETWSLEERSRDPGRFSRKLVYEFRSK